MGSVSRMPGRRPASVLITVVLMAVAYWLLPLSGDSTGGAGSDAPASAPSAVVVGQTQGTSAAGAAGQETESRDGPPNTGGDQQSRRTSDHTDGPQDLLYGLLREVSRQRYLSPEGLLYGPGSAEGHRLEHLRRHTEDDPSRPGSHGVFEGGMSGALQTIDLAYQRAKTGQRTTKQIDDDRTIYTVDLGRRIGFVGGSEGKRRGNPMARRVRFVLEGNYVVTAFPL